jgi:5-methylcytosine-specific restriction endonuclease McrA
MDTLLVNADGSPFSLIPLSVVTWQEAMRLVATDKVKVIKYYDKWEVHTVNKSYRVPSVIMSVSYVKQKTSVRYNRSNVFLRDNFQCQICTKYFNMHDLTIDHVIPRSYGGKTSWLNVTTACKDCNSRKGNDITVTPVNKPYRPTYFDLVKNRKKLPLVVSDTYWATFLDWSPELIELKDRHKNDNSN